MSVLSLSLAVAVVVLAMSVFSGYETTLKQSIQDITGHLSVSPKQVESETLLRRKLKPLLPGGASLHSFLSFQALLISDGLLSGVNIEGVKSAVFFQSRLVEGEVHPGTSGFALIGKGLARRFKLKPGSRFHIVLPKTGQNAESWQFKRLDLTVQGILDLGFHGFNERQVIVPIEILRDTVHRIPRAVSGFRVWFPKPEQSRFFKDKWTSVLGKDYVLKTWENAITSLHPQFFYSVKREKFLIFFILMVLVVAGAFNTLSHLFISVLQQSQTFCILKVMGTTSKFIFFLVLVQGFLISLAGSVLGILLGWGGSKALLTLQTWFYFIPSEVYKVETIISDIRFIDIFWILLCSFCICFIASIVPALRALRMPLYEGLRNE